MPFAGTSSINPGKDIQHNFLVDYTHPVTQNFLIETGVKTVLQNINSIAEVSAYDKLANNYLPDATQSYVLNYRQNVYAAYLSTTFSLGSFLNVMAGAKFEHTDIQIDFPGTAIPYYNNLVPSIIFSHKFSKSQPLKLAYTKRLERPEYKELNPFLNLSDPYNITTGNPALVPEKGNNFELGYSKSFDKGGSIYVAFVERINTSDVKNYTAFYPSFLIGDSSYKNVSVTNRRNVGTEYNTGLIVTASLPILKSIRHFIGQRF